MKKKNEPEDVRKNVRKKTQNNVRKNTKDKEQYSLHKNERDNACEKEREVIENQLLSIAMVECSSWTAVFLLMKKVQEDKLYLPEYKSFEAWVNDLSRKSLMHVSNWWQYYEAGKYYDEYIRFALKRGIQIPATKELRLSPSTVDVVMDIMHGNPELESADYLIQKLLANNASRYDFKKSYAMAESETKKRKAVGKRTRSNNRREKDSAGKKNNEKPKFPITAEDVLNTIKGTTEWFEHTGCGTELSRKSRKQEHKYSVFKEVAVRTGGTSNSARRIDTVAIENYSVQYPSELVIRGAEIKVNKSDLLDDHKMAEYMDFVDYFYIAVPDFLVDDALSICLPEWGILSVSLSGEYKNSYSLSVVQQAKKLEGVMREKTLAEILFKSI